MHSEQPTALDGTLIRWHKNTWAWSDHSPSPSVHDLNASDYYNFRVRSRRWVEALLSTVQQNADLHWIIKGSYELSLSGYHYGQIIVHPDGRMTRASNSGKVIPQVYLVPIAHWDLHDHCIAAQWPHKDHQAILAKALSLGCTYVAS